MADQHDPMERRLARIERTNRILVGIISTTFLLMGSALLAGFSQPTPSQESLRARSLIIEDSSGRPRIVMGAPIPDRNAAGNPRAGLIIHDAAGVERFGLGLQESGGLVVGLDAPPGKGDDRNRERITLGPTRTAEATSVSWIAPPPFRPASTSMSRIASGSSSLARRPTRSSGGGSA
jgi:hypothetical protein